jgi:hypothetical protein
LHVSARVGGGVRCGWIRLWCSIAKEQLKNENNKNLNAATCMRI